MSNPETRALLREALHLLTGQFPFAGSRRGLARRIRDHLEALAEPGDRLPIVILARSLWSRTDGVAIDPDETATRPHAQGVQVRGWLLVRHDDIPETDPATIAHVETLLGELPSRTREVFLLNRVDGLTYDEIAMRLRLSKDRVERHMIRAIAHIDGWRRR